MSQYLFPKVQTDLDLNGPILSFSTNPVGLATTSGASVTLTGIATVTFATTATPDNAGSISYRWYESGVGALSDNTKFAGTGTTTLTISDAQTPGDNNRKFYLEADYIPALNQTGKAINGPLQSGIATITVNPDIEIVSEPSNRQALIGANATFTVNADLTDNSYGTVSYQWQVDGVNVSDGSVQKTFTESTTISTNVDRTFTSDGSITLTNATNVELTVAGAQGGDGGSDAGGPGGGGYQGRAGKFPYVDGSRTLEFKIGRRGNGGSSGNASAYGSGGASTYAKGGDGGGAGPGGWSGGGGGGGGATAVYDSVKGGYTIVSAGGGGGGGGSWNRGAQGPPNGIGVGLGYGRVQSAMASGSSSPDPGDRGSTPGGDGGGGGGGGGGAQPSNYPGSGGGGAGGADNSHGGSGGNGGASGYDPNYATFNLDGYGNDGDGYVNIKFTGTSQQDTSVVRTTTFSGTNTDTLTINSDRVGIQTVRCIVSSTAVPDSTGISTTVRYIAVDDPETYNVNIEAIGNRDTATLSSVNLFNGEYEFNVTGSDPTNDRFTTEYVFYCPDKDLNVEMDLYGGKGIGFDEEGGTNAIENFRWSSGAEGGEGGYSRIRFTMTRNTEYVIAGLTESVNAPFIYRKSTLIACVGGGGYGGHYGRGGQGGGVNVAGESGQGRSNGIGGIRIDTGTLPSSGIFGSLTTLESVTPDTNASGSDGGRTIPCTRGVYYRNQGVSECSDVGQVKFRLSNGTEVTNTTSSITRGYKSGYNIIQTAGTRGGSDGGNGGNGATGGGAGNSSGGGGGSGYTNGEVTIIDSQLGGSTGDAKVILRIVS